MHLVLPRLAGQACAMPIPANVAAFSIPLKKLSQRTASERLARDSSAESARDQTLLKLVAEKSASKLTKWE